MAMYISDNLLIDSDYIVSALKVDGVEESDGKYFIALMIGEGESLTNICADYNIKEERDQAFSCLKEMLQASSCLYELNIEDEMK